MLASGGILQDRRVESSGPLSGLVELSNRQRLIAAALDCLARHGSGKTTIDDVARRAGLSRATVYRAFPGGRDELLKTVVDSEVALLFGSVASQIDSATSLEDALSGGITVAVSLLRGHAALAFLVEHEPDLVLGHLAFADLDRLLGLSATSIGPLLRRWLPSDEAARVAEWATRIVLSYAFDPSAGIDLADPSETSRFVSTYLLPGIASAMPEPPRIHPG